MMEKLEKLVDDLLAAAAEVRTYYARQNGGELPLKGKARRGRPVGREKEKVAPVPVDVDLLNTPAQPQLSAADSQRQAEDMARALVQRFNKPVEGKPQGFHLAKKLLAEFGAQRLADLNHDQRVQFAGEAREIIAQADKQPAAAGVGV